MTARNCPFCRTDSVLFLPEPGYEWRRVSSRTLARVGEVTLCAGLGALVEPYVLAYPTQHFKAVAELPATICADLVGAMDRCLASGLFPSGALAVFEHGGGIDVSHGADTACLEHCHLHLIDHAFDLERDFSSIYPEAFDVALDSAGTFSAELGYLFAGRYDGHGSLTGKVVAKPGCGSQFFRRLLAAKTGLLEWNWKLAPNPEAAKRLCVEWSGRVTS